ncbi:MAG TPA: hypothetical protein VGR55_02735 [Candidatus Acidoferrum sp.]|nr:hypothetical protein [Candidatus Acidoferrum sp.]
MRIFSRSHPAGSKHMLWFRNALLTGCFILLTSSCALAQLLYDGNNNLPPFGGFSGSDFDTVSLQNGNLHLHIPLGFWKQRGGRTFSYYFIYDTPTWIRNTTIDLMEWTHPGSCDKQ